jgi:hypothetical protein
VSRLWASLTSLRGRFAAVFCDHAYVLTFEPRRLFLRCDSCGRQTAGWVIGK